VKKKLLVLGSTGSIGTQTLDLVRASAGELEVTGLAAARSWEKLAEQALEFAPRAVALQDPEHAARLRARLPARCELYTGPEAIETLVNEADFEVAVHGVVGSAGLPASIAVLRRGARLALANKESLVIAGEQLMRMARDHGAEIVPVDSEHSAIHQCLRGERIDDVRCVWLTASGGPFRTIPLRELASATPQAALRHPNWAMGPRITIGSSTLMNKALEVIELHHLFGLEAERIRVVIHPQSIVHSMVEFCDGSVIAQMGPPDMRGPIHYALHHPERAEADLPGFDFARFASLSFEQPDPMRFPALELGYRCLSEGSDSGCVLNAADEAAVEAFLQSKIGYDDILRINRAVLDRRRGLAGSIEELLEADRLARMDALDEIRATASS
jgi:1-deoxy-D-xylulose-5-phosphate reductoisomerase